MAYLDLKVVRLEFAAKREPRALKAAPSCRRGLSQGWSIYIFSSVSFSFSAIFSAWEISRFLFHCRRLLFRYFFQVDYRLLPIGKLGHCRKGNVARRSIIL